MLFDDVDLMAGCESPVQEFVRVFDSSPHDLALYNKRVLLDIHDDFGSLRRQIIQLQQGDDVSHATGELLSDMLECVTRRDDDVCLIIASIIAQECGDKYDDN